MKHALVIGAGRSGIAATRLLLEKGIRVSLFDDQPQHQLRFFKDACFTDTRGLRTFFACPFDERAPFDCVVLSPGVDHQHPLVNKALHEGIPIYNEIEVALLFTSGKKIIGITGTNGKSTATVMLESILRTMGVSVIAGGNLGTPLCDLITREFDYVVLELSSFQLETLKQITLEAAVILNITPDHLDRYPSFEAYRQAKFNILSLVKPGGLLVAHRDLELVLTHPHYPVAYFSAQDLEHAPWNILQSIDLGFAHNFENALAVAKTAHYLGASEHAIVEGLKRFHPLHYRCEMVGEKSGITFINDSKGTTVVAVEKAVASLKNRVHLLLGGMDKGEDFSSLAQFSHVASFSVYGHSQAKIVRELNDTRVSQHASLREAFCHAQRLAQAGDIVLLSPGCASYDQFKDYVERGELFNTLVNEL